MHESGDQIIPWGSEEEEENMRTCVEDESDAAKRRDYSLVGTLVELFKGPCKRGTVSYR